MKQIYKLLLLFVLSLGSSALIAQSDSCYNATPFCDSVNQYAATTSGISAPFGNNYGCLGSEPNPTFFTLTVSQSGSIDITLLNTANVDIDFILWGPYADAATAQSFCGNLGNGNAANGNLVDTCSYSGAAIEYVQISNAVAGSVYILMITNFSQQPTNIYSTSNSGTGSIGCPCNLGYNIDTLPYPINNGFLTDTSVVYGQYVVCPDQQLGIQIGVSGNSTDTLQIYQPFTTINNVFPGATLFTAPGLNHDTISIGATLTPDRSHIGIQQFDIAVNSTTPTNTCQEIVTIEVVVPGIDLRDTTICSGDSIRIPIDTFPVTYVGFSQYQWTQIGGTPATISDDTLAQPSISAPPLPLGVAFDSIVLQVDFSYGGCITVDTVTIIVIGVPDGSFTYPDVLYCQQGVTNPTAVVTGTPGGTFSSNTGVVFANTSTGEIDLANTPTGNHNIFYDLSSPGGQCDARDTFNLDIIGITTFQALASQYFICDNELDTIQLSLNVAYGGTAPSGPTYSWTPTANLNNPNIQNPLAFLLTPDTFVVSYDDGVCAVQTDTVAIAAPYPANITVSPDATICNGATIQLGATVAASSGNQDFCIPAATAITVENTTLITLNVSGVAPSVINSALIASLSTKLGINMNAIGQLTIDLIAPSGEIVNLSNRNGGLNNAFPYSSFSSTGNTSITSIPFFGGIPTASFLPQAGATGFNTLLGATTNGTWTLRIVHNNGGLGILNGTLTDWCICFEDLSQATFAWSPNYNISCVACDSPFVNPTVDTAYMAIAQNAFGCRDTGIVNITIDSALPTPIITCGNITTNSVTFNWGLIPGAAGYSVSIDGGTPNIIGANVDSFQVTGLIPSQCAQIVIFALSGTSCLDGAPDSLICCAIGCNGIDPLIITPNGPTTFCFGQSVILDAGAGFASYQWSTAPNDTNQTVTVTTTQLVGVTTTDALGCLDTGSIVITVTPGPVPTITPSGSTTLCAGDTVFLDAGAFASYAWSPSGNTQTIPATTSAVHVVTVTDINGCVGFDSIIVNVGSPLLVPMTKTDVSCNGAIPGDGSATVTPSGGFIPYNFLWSTGGTTATISNLSVGTYIVTVTDNNGCVAIDSITIIEPTPVVASTTGTPVSCNGSSDGIARAFGAGGTPGYTFLWDANAGNQTTAFATGLLPGTYCVTVTDINGCVDSTCATILQTTQTFSASGSTTICEGDSAQLTSTLADGYTWTPAGSLSAANVQNPMAYPTTTTTYYVSADILSGVNIIYNGDFEDGDVGFSSAYTVGTGGAFGQLSNAGTYAVNTNASNTHNNFAPCTDHTSTTGNFMVVNGATIANQSIWCQTVNVTPNTNYQFSTWITSVEATNPANLQFSINGVNVGNPFTASATTCQWNQFFATWNSGASTTATICINNQNTNNAGNDFGLDDIEFIPICNMVDSVVVTVNPRPVITTSNNTPICENNDINLSSTGGLNYNWSGPNAFTSAQQNPSILNALAVNSGQYIVTVTTALGCSDTASTNVIVNQHPSVTISNTPVLCFGTSTGTATANAVGGGGGYTYTWSNTQTVNPITNLPIGAYQVTVVDVNGCFDSSSTTITQPSQVTATIATVPVSCNGGTDGTATATVGGGTPGVPTYTYDWGFGATALATSPGQAAGVYTVTISDANGCSITESYTITEPSAITYTVSSTAASCNGASDGTATINASGGVGGFTYAWNSSAQTTATAIGLPAGLHCVTVTDGNGCTIDTCIQVNEPAGFSNINFTTINVSCFGGSDGSATISLTGGVGAYTYNWSNGDNTATATGLDANTHSVTVTDANGCTVTANVVITQPTALQISLNVDSVQCKNGSDGSVTAVITGGTFPYTYQWDPSTGGGGQVTATANNLNIGTYFVTVTDFNGCTIVGSATVFEPATVLTAAIINQLNPSCNGTCDGSIEVDAQGATPNYTYQWSNGQNTSIASNVCAGAHTVTVTDANGCSVSTGSVLTEPTAITLNPQILSNYNGAAISCNGADDGSVGVAVAGGSGGYSFVWSPQGQNTANISGLVAGTYCVTVTDIAGCSMDTCITIVDPVQLAATFTSVDVLCNGDANGQILVNATTGTGTLGLNGYEYRITGPGQTGNVFSSLNNYNNLVAGSYTVFVRDGNNCEISLPISIGEPDSVLIDSVVITDALCNGTATGTATAHASGGVGGFTYIWSTSPVQTTQTATGLAAGVYSVTVADANGCDRVDVFNVGEPTVLTGSITANTIDCFGGTTSATALGSGGTPAGLTGYVYNWSNGTTSATTIGLAAGVHCVTITDDNACSYVECVTITQPSTALTATIAAQTDATCNGLATGTATAQGTGGTAPYTYLWDAAAGNQTTAMATGLGIGVYTVVVTDTNGCTAQTTVTISEPSPVLASITSTTGATCNGVGSGSATAAGTGGVGPYTYLWPDAQTGATATSLAGGTYVVTVSDANGCTATATAIITEPTAVLVTVVATTDVSCHGGNDGTASISMQGGTPTNGYTIQWSGAPGLNSPNATGLSAGVQTVTLIDANGCFDIDTFTINEPVDALSGYLTTADALCFGSATGELGAIITGGTAPYSYAWNSSPAQATVVADSLVAGTYTVLVTDANGCTFSLTGVVGEPTELAITANVLQDVTCFGGSNGLASVVTTTGGVGPYTYVWTDPTGQTGLSASNLSAGVVSVIVTDANACTAMATVTLTEGSPITVTNSVTNISCNGLTDGSIDITSSNKVLVAYNWSNGLVGNPVIGLGAGTYTVTVTDVGGCQDEFTYTITEPDPISLSIVQTSTILCYGAGNAAAQVTGTGGTAPYTYNWSSGATTRTASNLAPGSYDVTVTDSRGCFEITSITIVQPEELTITGSTTGTLCAGDQTGTLTAIGVGGTVISGLLEYSIDGSTWQNGNIFSGLASGIYTLSVRDENGCTVDTMLVVEDADPFFISSMTGDTTIEYLDSMTVEVTLNDTAGVTFAWNQILGTSGLVTDSTYSFGISPPDGVQYQFTATNSNGCSVDSIVIVDVTKLRRVNAPTGFSPNGDGVNDYFFVQGGDKVQEITIFRVYDRWGTLVFEGNNIEINIPEQGWDGVYRGRPATSGTYTWYSDVLFKDGHTEQIKGNIILLR